MDNWHFIIIYLATANFVQLYMGSSRRKGSLDLLSWALLSPYNHSYLLLWQSSTCEVYVNVKQEVNGSNGDLFLPPKTLSSAASPSLWALAIGGPFQWIRASLPISEMWSQYVRNMCDKFCSQFALFTEKFTQSTKILRNRRLHRLRQIWTLTRSSHISWSSTQPTFLYTSLLLVCRLCFKFSCMVTFFATTGESLMISWKLRDYEGFPQE